MHLHPVMYVPDQYAERAFYELFGFQRWYEGDEFPGFLAVRHGEAVIGLQRSSADHPAYAGVFAGSSSWTRPRPSTRSWRRVVSILWTTTCTSNRAAIASVRAW